MPMNSEMSGSRRALVDLLVLQSMCDVSGMLSPITSLTSFAHPPTNLKSEGHNANGKVANCDGTARDKNMQTHAGNYFTPQRLFIMCANLSRSLGVGVYKSFREL